MAETANIAEVASKVANDIFRVFHWETHAQRDTNFECVCEHHLTDNDKKKLTHPADVVFHYRDPYWNQRVYLHTDLKSYKKSTIQQAKIRDALKSLAMTVECAHVSPGWAGKFEAHASEPRDIKGLLFVVNHDNKAVEQFRNYLQGIARTNIPVAKGQALHVLGPEEINKLYSIATDIRLLKEAKGLPDLYRFYYPDLTLWKRSTADDQRVPATIETLLSPYFILTHDSLKGSAGDVVLSAGSVVYYSREGSTVEEFIYLIDSLSRYQLVNSKTAIRVRVCGAKRSSEYKNNFEKAKAKYCATWGFQEDREAEVKAITIDAIQPAQHNYSPDEIGWRPS